MIKKEKGTNLFFYSKADWRVWIGAAKINLSPFYPFLSYLSRIQRVKMNELPHAGVGLNDAMRKKIKLAATAANLASASNNTKWNELIDHFRQREGWRPSYRHKSVTGHISYWDVEWFYHLPFPFAAVQWFDISLTEAASERGRMAKPAIDHADEISALASRIGFEFEVRGDVLRVWGYLPRTYEDFPPA
jgi:hypothetical protein